MSSAIWDAFIAEQSANQPPTNYTDFKDFLHDYESPPSSGTYPYRDLADDFFKFLNQSTNQVSDLFEMFTQSATGGATVWEPLLDRIVGTFQDMDDCTPKDSVASEFFSKFDLSEVGGLGEIFYEKFFPNPPTWGSDPIDTFDKLLAAIKDGEPLTAIEDTLRDNMNTSKCNSTFQQNHANQFATEAANFIAYHTNPKLFTGKITINSTSPLFASAAGVKVLWYSEDSSGAELLASAVTNGSGEFPINYSKIEGIDGYTPDSYPGAGIKFQDSRGNFFTIGTGTDTFLAKEFPPDSATTIDMTLVPAAASIVLYPSYSITLTTPYTTVRNLLTKTDGTTPSEGDISDLITGLTAFATEYGTVNKLNTVRENGGLRNYLIEHPTSGANPDNRYVKQFDAHVFLEPLSQNMLFRRWLIYSGLESISDISSINRSEMVRLRNSFNTANPDDKISDYEAAALHQKSKAIAYYLDNLTIDWRINHE